MSADGPDGRPGQPPLVIAGGFYPTPLPNLQIAGFYREQGIEAVFVPWRANEMCDVRAYAQGIADCVRQTANAYGGRVNLIGFSLGGPAALYAIKRLDLDSVVATFVSYAGPFRGAFISWLALPTIFYAYTGLQMLPDSPFLEELARGPLPTGPRYISVAGSLDPICSVESAHLDGADNLTVPHGHLDILYDPELHLFLQTLFR